MRQAAYLVVLFLGVGLTTSASAQWWWPPDDCSHAPAMPICSDMIRVTVGGVWPTTCIPTGSAVNVVGSTIVFDVFDDHPKGTFCGFGVTPWSRSETVGTLPAGIYTIVARWYERGELRAGPTELCEITVSPHRADVDEDGAIGFTDLVAILAAWGPCAGCPEDVNGDGVVALTDLLAVLDAWGSCP